ncbi:MAG: amidase [Deltaproteobacteria bacterium]|jgi:amidase|nr:amidase [Deltaproteobacteria bacterium]
MNEIIYENATNLADKISAGELSSEEVVKSFIKQIKKYNSRINAVVTLNEKQALKNAKLADRALKNKESIGPLHGVPFTVKDSFQTRGVKTTSACKLLGDYIPDQDAEVVKRLLNAGAILLAKTNLPKLAMDTQSDNKIFGATNNPWNIKYTAGGSSGGEAAAVASGMSPLGIGSDIGGSVRIPAHFCGVYALKPTNDLVPMQGHIPPLPQQANYVRHLATAGPITRSLNDLELAFQVISNSNQSSSEYPPLELPQAKAKPLNQLKIAWNLDFGDLPLSATTEEQIKKLVSKLEAAGCTIEKAKPRELSIEDIWTAYGNLFGSMLSANIPAPLRYLLRIFGPLLFKDTISKATARGATGKIKHYFQYLENQEHLISRMDNFFEKYDVWLSPVTPAPAFVHRKMNKIHTPVIIKGKKVPGNIAAIGITSISNLTGNPSLTIPLTLAENNLPIGVQLTGPRWHEAKLFAAARQIKSLIPDLSPPLLEDK